jgi:hypothetical protein
MEVFGLDLEVECIVMMERPSWTLKVKRVKLISDLHPFNRKIKYSI